MKPVKKPPIPVFFHPVQLDHRPRYEWTFGRKVTHPETRVFFASIHGDPRKFYPCFSGYDGETGRGEGRGTDLNVPLPAGTDGRQYLRALRRKVLPAVKKFRPVALVISAGYATK